MSCITFRQTSIKQGTARPAPRSTVRVMAVHQPNKPVAGFAAAAAAAMLLASSAPAMASLNPTVPELAKNPINKLLTKLDEQDPPKGVSGPKVEGSFRSNPAKARELALENSPAGSPEAEAKAAREGGRAK